MYQGMGQSYKDEIQGMINPTEVRNQKPEKISKYVEYIEIFC